MNSSEQIVEAIVRDLTDRRGLRQEWEQIDPEIQQEIKDVWKDIIVKKIEKLKEFIDPIWFNPPPKGLSPEFYRTLSYTGDLELYNKYQELIKEL